MNDANDRTRQQQGSMQDSPDFSLVLGGPLFQLLRKAHLSDDVNGLLRRRILFIPAFAWLPLLICYLVESRFSPPTNVAVTFLKDIETHSRYLIALPLLIYAELLVNSRMRPMVRQFQERKIV